MYIPTWDILCPPPVAKYTRSPSSKSRFDTRVPYADCPDAVCGSLMPKPAYIYMVNPEQSNMLGPHAPYEYPDPRYLFARDTIEIPLTSAVPLTEPLERTPLFADDFARYTLTALVFIDDVDAACAHSVWRMHISIIARENTAAIRRALRVCAFIYNTPSLTSGPVCSIWTMLHLPLPVVYPINRPSVLPLRQIRSNQNSSVTMASCCMRTFNRAGCREHISPSIIDFLLRDYLSVR